MSTLEILYRDQWIVAINKPAGMLVHPGADKDSRDPVAMKILRDQLGKKVWVIHRLDQPTSGVVVFSLSDELERFLRIQFERREVEKTYCAVVAGVTPDEWTMNEPLRKDETEPFREAETRFVRRHTCDEFSVLHVTPITGRHHQIRKHLAMAGFPIVGDYRYGHGGDCGLMLHAEMLEITHPIANENLLFSAPLPDRFAPFRKLPTEEN